MRVLKYLCRIIWNMCTENCGGNKTTELHCRFVIGTREVIQFMWYDDAMAQTSLSTVMIPNNDDEVSSSIWWKSFYTYKLNISDLKCLIIMLTMVPSRWTEEGRRRRKRLVNILSPTSTCFATLFSFHLYISIHFFFFYYFIFYYFIFFLTFEGGFKTRLHYFLLWVF